MQPIPQNETAAQKVKQYSEAVAKLHHRVAHRTGKVLSIFPAIVHQGDRFSPKLGTGRELSHVPLLDPSKRDDWIGAYQSDEPAVADEELALQDVVGILVAPGHQVGVPSLLPSIKPSWEPSPTFARRRR